jgi:hypothetical protein
VSKRKVERARDGTFRVRLTDDERDLVATLASQLRELLVVDSTDGTERLFPPAYANDPDREVEYHLLTHDELLQSRLGAVDVFEQSLAQTSLEEDQLNAWMASINSLRLVLGTRLDITEEMDDIELDDPRAGAFAVYHYLTHLLWEIVDALST